MISQVVKIECDHGWTPEGISRQAPGGDPVLKTAILDDKGMAKRVVQCCAKEKEAKVVVRVWVWWSDGSCSDDGWVSAAVMCEQGSEWRTCCSYLRSCWMEVFDAEL